MLRKLRLAIRTARDVVEARDLCARGDGAKAMTLLDGVYRNLSACQELANEKVFVELDLLRSQIAIQVEDGPLALSAAEAALERLELGDAHYRPSDRMYLTRYARALIHYCRSWRDQKHVLRPIDIEEIDLKHVSSHLKENYALPAGGSFI